jgi:predicted nuclease of restriction endonuclease-like (RecB) superfamily
MNQQLLNQQLLQEICSLIDESRKRLATSINREMTLVYWNIGKLVQTELLNHKRSEYGEQVVLKLGQTLQSEYGTGFGLRVLRRAIQFYQNYTDFEIVSTLSTQLSWSHFVELLSIQNQQKRDFYAEMCRMDSWSVRTLREKIGKMLFERTAISKQPEKVIEDSLTKVRQENKLTPDLVFQDPYVIDFLNLPQNYNESDLEKAILDQIERFLMELGVGFCFVARQKRIAVGGNDFYIDLVLYNRHLKRLFIIELKTTSFKPSHKGQMEFYLNWINKNERQPDEGSPVGIILCTEKDEELIKLFDLVSQNIHVAEYLTVLPPKEIFEKKIQEIVQTTTIAFSKKCKPSDMARVGADVKGS